MVNQQSHQDLSHSHRIQSLLLLVFEKVCLGYGRPLVDLFVKRRSYKTLINSSSFWSMAWKEDAFQDSWDHLDVYSCPLTLFLEVINYVMASASLSMIWWPLCVVVSALASQMRYRVRFPFGVETLGKFLHNNCLFNPA